MPSPRVLLLSIVLLGALAFPPAASACSCVPPEPGESRSEQLRQNIRAGDAAIVGRLVSVTRPEQGPGEVPVGPGIAWFRYRTLYVVKGRPRLQRGRIVAVKTSGDGATCGLYGQVGRRYGLVLDRSEGRWWGNLCQMYGPKMMRAQGSMESGRSARTGCAS